MENKHTGALSGVGFYATLAICLLAVGVGGYFLLFGGQETAQEEEEEAPQTAVTAQAPEIPAEDPVETVSPAELTEEETPEAEPAPVLDDTPVVAAIPQVVVAPLEGEVVAAFSVDQLAYNETLGDWRTHDGVDIAAAEGTSVLAASGGTVLSVSDDLLMGTTVVVEHADGYQTTYANLQEMPPVAQEDTVTAGQVIGTVGTTAPAESAQGPHLHFSVSKDGDAVDPDTYLNG